jgi:signal transduction histidine kinase
MLAPSFPAEFPDLDPGLLVGALRRLGFEMVVEVAFGADMVADRYRRLLQDNPDRHYIGVNCPALITFVEKYHPELVPYLAPVVSPMIAMARAMSMLHGEDLSIVFIGPCIAKKAEAEDPLAGSGVDQVMTFSELRDLLALAGIDPSSSEPSEFDAPQAGLGALFAVSRGMLQAADIKEDLAANEVVTASGRQAFVEALKEFEAGDGDIRLLEILCCNGCIMGPGMTSSDQRFRRRSNVSRYARERLSRINFNRWQVAMNRFRDLDLSRGFSPNDTRMRKPSEEELRPILERIGKTGRDKELNCGACGYDTCREHAIAIYDGLAESEMCLPYVIEQLQSTLSRLAESHEELASAREALQHAEKMASMGQLAAGIAHEVNNPLGVVLMYAHMLLESCERESGLTEDLQMIAEQADRCRKIVSGLLDFARQNKVVHIPTDIPDLVRRTVEVMNLPQGIEFSIDTGTSDPVAEIDPDQIAQVLTNLVSNSLAAMPDGGEIRVAVTGDEHHMTIEVRDSGTGIPQENLQRVFEPFFTTKKMGKGTGLGLAVTYGIVKMHRGQIGVASNPDPSAGPTWTAFTVVLPRTAPAG